MINFESGLRVLLASWQRYPGPVLLLLGSRCTRWILCGGGTADFPLSCWSSPQLIMLLQLMLRIIHSNQVSYNNRKSSLGYQESYDFNRVMKAEWKPEVQAADDITKADPSLPALGGQLTPVSFLLQLILRLRSSSWLNSVKRNQMFQRWERARGRGQGASPVLPRWKHF